MIALASAVAVNTAVAAAPIKIHIVIVAEPFGGFVSLEYRLARNCKHNTLLKSKIPLKAKRFKRANYRGTTSFYLRKNPQTSMRYNGRKPYIPTLSFGIQAPRRNSQSNGILSHPPRTLLNRFRHCLVLLFTAFCIF